ncbi:hypothetical protein FOZ63_023902, partial [Perkinsus olseni]
IPISEVIECVVHHIYSTRRQKVFTEELRRVDAVCRVTSTPARSRCSATRPSGSRARSSTRAVSSSGRSSGRKRRSSRSSGSRRRSVSRGSGRRCSSSGSDRGSGSSCSRGRSGRGTGSARDGGARGGGGGCNGHRGRSRTRRNTRNGGTAQWPIRPVNKSFTTEVPYLQLATVG